MNTKKRYVMVGITTAMILAGCSQSIQDPSEEYIRGDVTSAAVTSERNGFMNDSASQNPFLFNVDFEQGAMTWLCGKAECDHGSDDCSAYFEGGINPYSIQVYKDKLYVEALPPRQGDRTLYEIDLDGSNRREVMKIDADMGGLHVIRNDVLYIFGTDNMNSMENRRGTIYKQALGDEEAECIYTTEGAGTKWRESSIAVDMIETEDKVYFMETRANENDIEVAIMEFSVKEETCRELIKENASLVYDVIGDQLFYYTCQYIEATDETVYGPVMVLNLNEGTKEETNLPKGMLEDCDENYAYYVRRDVDTWIDIYDYDGKLVKSLQVPREEMEKTFVGWNISFTDHMIVIGMHYMLEDMDTFDITNYDTYYVMPKTGIEEKEPEWIVTTLVSEMRAGDWENVSYELIAE